MQSKLKDEYRTLIKKKTIDLFLASSIEQVTIADVAKANGIGEATMYRYFKNKYNLVSEVMIMIGESIFDNFIIDDSLTGIEKIKCFYQKFIDTFNDNPNYYKLIQEFDLMISNSGNLADNNYDEIFERFYNIYLSYYEQGLKDNTIKKIKDIRLFYNTSTHSIMSLCKKLASQNLIISSDNELNKIDELELLIKCFMNILERGE